MRLKNISISDYKNLKDFSLAFDGDSFIDIFVGKNGSGKSNLFEALILILQHIFEYDQDKSEPSFDYGITFLVEESETTIEWKKGKLFINGKPRKTIGKTSLPDNVLIYYSGHNDTVSDLVRMYEDAFRKRIRTADFAESRSFIGIGPEYKELLLAVLLMQPEVNAARRHVCKKLGVISAGSEVRLILERPSYASDGRFDIVDPESDRYWKPEGITKDFLDRLSRCINTSQDSPLRAEGYFSDEDRFILYFSIAEIQKEFADLTAIDLFRQLDNLKTLGMLADITITLQLEGGAEANITYFSDGQFQSIYVCSVVELFKDHNCITLLDEPDCFLHPEWQFGFLDQVSQISDAATKKNHILVSSHSASTIASIDDSVINLVEISENKVLVTKVKKADVIKSLSAGLISFTEGEARLNIHHLLKNTSGPVLFTEGISDEMILEVAYAKLYPTEERPFDIQKGFGCGFLRNLMKDQALYRNNPGRVFFALFDFDEAYNNWNQPGEDVENDPSRCLTKKHPTFDSYTMLLPVPATGQMHRQVINPHTGGTYGHKSLLTMELLFHGVPGLDQYFAVDTARTDNFIKFVSDGQKVTFARDVVPTIDAQHFEIFRPLFEFIKTQCAAAQAAA